MSRTETHPQLPETWQELAVANMYIYAVFAIGVDETLLSWNPGVKVVLGYDEADFVGQRAHIIFTQEDRRNDIPEHELRLAREQGNANDVRQHLRADGSMFWATGAMTALRDEAGQLQGYAKVVRDSSESKVLEQSLENLNAHLEDEVETRTDEIRRLAAQLSLAEQQERRRLARTLHDSVQQELYAVQFSLAGLRKELKGRQAAETLTDADALLRKTIVIARDIASNLSPAALDDDNLCAALQWLAQAMEAKHGLRVKVVSNDVCIVESNAVRTLLFDLTRELLFNTVKHAGVKEAVVTLKRDDDGLELSVEDEGEGFVYDLEAQTSAAGSAATGLGLRGAHKRLRLFGGSLKVATSPGEGTRITIYLGSSSFTLE